MELEFDKEIDAILRRARHADTAAPKSEHLDADVIAAFAENALPERARSQYTLHLADCDRCRKHLSQTISISDGAVETTAKSPILAPAAEVTVPWYKAIFRTPNLAIAMGGLILVFSGVLGFLVLQNNRSSQNAIVSQVSEPPAAGSSIADSANFSVNSNSSIASDPELMASNNSDASLFSPANSAANTATTTPAEGLKKEVSEVAAAPAEEKNVASRQTSELPKVAAAPPPPAPAGVTMDSVAVGNEAKRDAETRQAELSDISLAAKRRELDTARSRDLPPAAANSGPGRSGPVQMQANQNARNAVQMTVTRSAGGRKFTNRDGAWYDTDYNGQATTNVKRGTGEFKNLDSGLRSIANQIDGVVVVVWKGKAYRIQ